MADDIYGTSTVQFSWQQIRGAITNIQRVPFVSHIDCCPSVLWSIRADPSVDILPHGKIQSGLASVRVNTRTDIPWGSWIRWLSDGSGTIHYRDGRKVTCVETSRRSE